VHPTLVPQHTTTMQNTLVAVLAVNALFEASSLSFSFAVFPAPPRRLFEEGSCNRM